MPEAAPAHAHTSIDCAGFAGGVIASGGVRHEDGQRAIGVEPREVERGRAAVLAGPARAEGERSVSNSNRL